jgi:DNA-directed RNA polymerase I, II, and III subunit RPABC1
MYAQSRRLFTMRQTLTKMLGVRGYTVPSDVATMTLSAFDSMYMQSKSAEHDNDDVSQLAFFAEHPVTGNKLVVLFPNDTDRSNLGIAPIRNFITVMQKHHCSHCILVVYESLTAPAIVMLKDLETKKVFISFFAENELMYNIYDHVRVPRHILLTPTEKTELLKSLNASEDLLPKLQKHDPMARYLGLVVGDVVKILRYSFTVGHDVYYRIVVDSEDFY